MEDKIHEALDRAQRAREVLEHTLFVEAFTALREQLIAQWTRTAINKKDDLTSLHAMVRALDMVQDYLKDVISSGVLAERYVTDMEEEMRQEAIIN